LFVILHGACCVDGVTCCCLNGFTGTLCQIPPSFVECTIDANCSSFVTLCKSSVCNASNNRCVTTPNTCDDSNACTDDSCDDTTGCVHNDASFKCNDNLGCTIDVCDNVTGNCNNTPIDCSFVQDVCNDAYCDNYALNDSERCLQRSVNCPRSSNCTIADCRLNYTNPALNLVNYDGCVNQTVFCDLWLAGIIAAITGGAIAGIVVAATFVAAAAMAAGSAYAVSSSQSEDSEGSISNNPTYSQQTKTSTGLAGDT